MTMAALSFIQYLDMTITNTINENAEQNSSVYKKFQKEEQINTRTTTDYEFEWPNKRRQKQMETVPAVKSGPGDDT